MDRGAIIRDQAPAIEQEGREESGRVVVEGRVIPAIPAADLARAKEFSGRTLDLQPVVVELPGSQLYRCGRGSYLVVYQAAGSRPEQHVATFLVDDVEAEVAALSVSAASSSETTTYPA